MFARGRIRPPPRPGRFRAAFAMAAALDALGTPPAESPDYVAAAVNDFGSFGNEDVGDCVEVDTANALILRTANAGPSAVVPTTDQVLDLYSAVGGYVRGDASTDNGTDEDTNGRYLVTNGFIGHKAAAVGPVDHTNLNHARWAQILFGTCRLCWNLPGYADDLILAGKPWDVQSTGDQTTQGHDTCMVDFRGGMLYVVSWRDSCGAYARHLVPVTPAFFFHYLDAAQGEVFPDWIKQQGVAPSGFDIAALVAKLKDVA